MEEGREGESGGGGKGEQGPVNTCQILLVQILLIHTGQLQHRVLRTGLRALTTVSVLYVGVGLFVFSTDCPGPHSHPPASAS